MRARDGGGGGEGWWRRQRNEMSDGRRRKPDIDDWYRCHGVVMAMCEISMYDTEIVSKEIINGSVCNSTYTAGYGFITHLC